MRRGIRGLVATFALVFLLPGGASAAAPPGITHIVEPGQTLFRIALAYGIPLERLMEANGLTRPEALRAGQRLSIPGASRPVPVEPYRSLSPDERRRLESSLREDAAPSPLGAGPAIDLVWPLLGPMTSPFGPRRGRFHAGLDIGSPTYQEVVAAADGEVAFAEQTPGGFGRVIVLRHPRDVTSIYAHLSVIIAREGETVRQGQPIGGVGTTGNATGPHLHFEVRVRGVPVDPRAVLPQTIDELVDELSRSRTR